MDFGQKTNIEIQALIASGQVSYNDTVYSKDWNEILKYDGVVFKSICSCLYIGQYPACDNNPPLHLNTCLPVIEAYASFDSLYQPPGI